MRRRDTCSVPSLGKETKRNERVSLQKTREGNSYPLKEPVRGAALTGKDQKDFKRRLAVVAFTMLPPFSFLFLRVFLRVVAPIFDFNGKDC